ncbi:hypothetical protein YC2023_098586 [Brassica napus]
MDTCTSIEIKFTGDVTIKTAPTSPHKPEQITTSSGFVAVVNGLEIGRSMVVLSSEGEEFEVVMELCQSKALASLQCSLHIYLYAEMRSVEGYVRCYQWSCVKYGNGD